jgi:hypothetical protein
MKGSIGAFALRFAAIAVLLAPGAAAQEQGQVRRVCRMVGFAPVCEDVYYPPPSPAPPPAARHATGTESTIRYNADDEERKAQLEATERGGISHRGTPNGSSLCPPPYQMTARDGCQR